MIDQPKPAPPNSHSAHQEKQQPHPQSSGIDTATASDGAREPDAGQDGIRVGVIRLPALSLPDMPASVSKRALWWGGLAALAVVGVLEWPVAAVVGAGSYVAEKLSREDAVAK